MDEALHGTVAGEADESKIKQIVLPRLAQATGSTFLRDGGDDDDDNDSSDDDEEGDIEIEPAVLDDFFGQISENDHVQLMINKAASRFEDVKEEDLIDFDDDAFLENPTPTDDKPLLGRETARDLGDIIEDLEAIQFIAEPAPLTPPRHSPVGQKMSPEYDPETESLFTPAVQSRASRHKSESSVTSELMMPPFNLLKQLAGAVPATQAFSTPLSTNKRIPVKSENLDWDESLRPVIEGKKVVVETSLPPQRVLRRHGKERQITFNFAEDDATENDSADDNDLDFRSPSKRKAMARTKKPLAPPLPGLDSDSEDDTVDVRSPSKKITSALAKKPPPPALGLAPPKSTLVQTQTLAFLGFRYHILYNIPVCIECEFGFLFNSFVKHAREGVKVEYLWSTTTSKRGNWTKPRKAAHHHRSMPLRGSKFTVKGGRLTMTDEEVEALVLQELRELGHDPEPHYHGPGHSKDQPDIVLWLPHDDQIGPVEGIRVFKNGFKCAEGACAREPFPYCSVMRGTMASHIRKEHPEKTPRNANFKKDISIQSICGNTNYNCFFEVRPGRLRSVDFQPHSELSVPDAVLLEQQQLFGNILDSTGSDADLIDPAYHQVGMAQFWTRFDFRVIEPLQEIVMSQREGVLGDFYHIQQAVVATFFEICIHARTANSALLRLIMKGCNIGRLPRKERFTIPRTSTLSIYVTIELLLLRWLLYALENPILDRDGNPLFKFDVLQSKSLGDLIDGARNNESVKDLAPRVVQALHYLYFPSDPSRSALDVTIEPVGAFLAILCLTSEGAPRPVADVPHYCARLQFSIRGRGFHHLAMTHVTLYSPSTSSKPHVLQKPTVTQTKRKGKAQQTTRRATRNNPIIESEESESESEDSSYSPEASVGNVGTMMLPAIQTNAEGTNWWDATAKPWCGKYLTEDEPTPYAHTRDTMRVFSAALRNRRKRAQVRWIDDERFLLDNNMINLQLYRTFIHSSLESLESFFCQSLLLGNTLESLGIRIDFNSLPDNGDTTTLGYSPLLGHTGMKGNVDSDKVLRKFIEDGQLLSLKNGQLSWNGDEADEWIASIHEATCRMFAITHLTQGSAGRVTEEAKMLFSNTRTARRHIFVHPGLNTLCIWSNYWKGTQKSGTFKEILRVIPHRPSRLILILLRILRPIALMYLGKHRVVGEEARGELLATYSSSLWASLGVVLNERLMYRSLREFYATPGQDGTAPFDFIFGARLHRQFVVTVQRKHIPGSPRYTSEVAKSKESIGDKQAGRSSQTSTQNYSVVESVIDQDPGFIEHYIEYSKKWHQYLELSTEPGENDIYLV